MPRKDEYGRYALGSYVPVSSCRWGMGVGKEPVGTPNSCGPWALGRLPRLHYRQTSSCGTKVLDHYLKHFFSSGLGMAPKISKSPMIFRRVHRFPFTMQGSGSSTQELRCVTASQRISDHPQHLETPHILRGLRDNKSFGFYAVHSIRHFLQPPIQPRNLAPSQKI